MFINDIKALEQFAVLPLTSSFLIRRDLILLFVCVFLQTGYFGAFQLRNLYMALIMN